VVSLSVNGKTYQVDVEPDVPLLWVIRDYLKLTGTKFGCGVGICGTCTIHVTDSRRCTGKERHHHRGTSQESSVNAGMGRKASSPVWLLPTRPDHAGRFPAP